MENRKLSFDYFHAHEAGQFTFYRIPKALFSDGRFSTLSGDAKILYGLLLDRMGLSLSNEWLDSNNHVYIYYPVETAMQNLNCAHGKVAALFKELTSIGLILKKRQGLGKPDIIYVMNFASGTSAVPPPIASDNSRESLQPDIQKAENRLSRKPKIGYLESWKSDVQISEKQTSHIRKNKTEINKTELNETELNETSSPNPSSGHSAIPVEEEEKIPSPVIDRDRLIETNQEFLSRFAGWGNAKYQAEALVDSILDALEALCRENAPDSRRLLHGVDTPVMIRFMEKAVKMDFSGVNNLTSYLKCVLLDFLRKNAIVGVSQQRPAPAASYDIYEIERMINEGGFRDANSS